MAAKWRESGKVIAMKNNTRDESNWDLETLEDTPPWEWPPDAADTLLAVLRNAQASEPERLLAAELAGEWVVINDELAETLLSILCNRDAPEELRGRAAISLGPVIEQGDIDGFEDPDDVPITEENFDRILATLLGVYRDTSVGKLVRRQALEASVRAPQDWHEDAVRAAYSSGDEDWKVTAVFCMSYVRGFEDQILESLDSKNPDIKCHAVLAAGNWEVDAAWPHIAALLTSRKTPKTLLLAAIEAAPNIRPEEAFDLLEDLLNSRDAEIRDAVSEAMSLAQEPWDEEDEDYEDDEDDEEDADESSR
jgi:hypothetical protein